MTLRKLTICLPAFLSLSVQAAGTAAQEAGPPNVLFIAVDDLKAIGTLFEDEKDDFLTHIYPDPVLRREVAERMTPNFQRLADQGLTFKSAYCPSPACVPSRAALMTGIRPHISGLAANETGPFFRDWEYEGERPLADAITLPELLRTNGWYTASTGKIYHNPREYYHQDGDRSWVDWTYISEGAGPAKRSKWSPQKGLPWGQKGGDDTPYTEMNDLRATNFIARVLTTGTAKYEDATFTLPEDKPFFLACGIYKPHLPFYATKDILNLFPVEEMTVTYDLLNYFIEDGRDLPDLALILGGFARDDDGDPVIGKDRFVDMLKHGKSLDPDEGDLKAWKDMIKHYLACVAVADRALGQLLDALEKSPYADNTMIILWSDHGYHLGEKLHATKFTLWDDGSRVPFIIKDPRRPQLAGQKCYTPVSLMDIYPTVASMAGLSLPDERITGNDLQPLLDDPKALRKEPAQVTFRRRNEYNQMLRSRKYKLIRYDSGGKQIELYDMEEDPEEYINLAGKSETADVEAEMKAQLKSILKQ